MKVNVELDRVVNKDKANVFMMSVVVVVIGLLVVVVMKSLM